MRNRTGPDRNDRDESSTKVSDIISSNNTHVTRMRPGEEDNTAMKTIQGVLVENIVDQHTQGDDQRQEDDDVSSLLVSDVCKDDPSSTERLRDREPQNICEQGESGCVLMTKDDEQHRPGVMVVLGADEEGGVVSGHDLRCWMSDEKAGRDDTDIVQSSCDPAKFREHRLMFAEEQEPHGMTAAPSKSEVSHAAKLVRPGENAGEKTRDILCQRQNLGTYCQLTEECSRSINSTGSAGAPS